jgi:hypothetical protein
MLQTVEGIYRDGKIELSETPESVQEARVIVTFLTERTVDLAERGISPDEAADLRARLGSFAEDWERPEMSAYDAL